MTSPSSFEHKSFNSGESAQPADQEPRQEQTADQPGLAGSPAHEPVRHVGTSLEDAYLGGHLTGMNPEDPSRNPNVPDFIPRDLRENTDAGGAIEIAPKLPGKHEEEKSKSLLKKGLIGLGVGTAAVAVVVATIKGANANNEANKKNEAIINGNGGRATTSETYNTNVDPNTLSVDQFFNNSVLPKEERVKWAVEKAEPRMKQAHAELSAALVKLGLPPLDPLVKPSLDNTGQEIMTRKDVVNYLASTTTDTAEGAKLLAAASDYRLVRPFLRTLGEVPLVALNRVVANSSTRQYIESPVFSSARAGTYNPNGIPSKIIVYNNAGNGQSYESIEQFIGGSWVTHTIMQPGNPNLITNPQQISDK